MCAVCPGDAVASGHRESAGGDGSSGGDPLPTSSSAHSHSHSHQPSHLAALQQQRQAELIDELQRRVEEAELAAAVQTRRAASAEAEVAALKDQVGRGQRAVRVCPSS